jgi:thiamine pyrophosphate-dependent acetolactate synthase large subunit-like protein
MAAARGEAATPGRTVRDATFDVFRRYGLTTIFANPGSTEISFLTDLPDDISFVLALHEGSVVGIATGYATARARPALVNLHTTAGLGNAVGALATARTNRVPLVVIVGHQDRRHLAHRPFLAGDLEGLAGDYPVWVHQPVRAQDVPGAVARGWHEAVSGRGPALIIVPSDDWAEPADDVPVAAPAALRRATAVDQDTLTELAGLVDAAAAPVLVVGADADRPEAWAALVGLAERLRAPVWQESFAARAGFPQDHPLFAGHLPAGRARLRQVLAGHDLVLAVGAPVFRQYPYEVGPLVEPGTTLALVTDDLEDAHHSPVQLAVVADPAVVCAAVAERVSDRPGAAAPSHPARVEPPTPPAGGEPLRAAHVMAALAQRLPAETVVVEETPSSRPDLHRLLPARAPLGFLSAAMGGLGFGLPAAVGVRMAHPRRPVVAVLGDGSSLYGIQGLWSAAHYGCGVLFVVLANGRYAVMDRLAERHGQGKAPWPAFEQVSIQQLALGFGCPAQRVDTHDALVEALDAVVPTLPGRTEPLVLEVAVVPDLAFDP